MPQDTESQMLDRVAVELQAEGYEVYLNPRHPLTPAFFGNFTPDAIARKQDEHLLIEIMRKSPAASAKLAKLNDLLKDQENWRLRVYWLEPITSGDQLPVQRKSTIASRLDEAAALAAAGTLEAALLQTWATFEAIARALTPDNFARAQSPRRIVESLAAEGYLTPSEALAIRPLIDKRNHFIHGALEERVTPDEIQKFIGILRALQGQLTE